MPTLILMRHAKAGHAPVDFDRPLAPRGRQQAAWQGSALARAVGGVDLAIVSSSARTRQTLIGLNSGGLRVAETWFEDSLYASSWEGILGLLQRVPEDAGSVIVVAHEPTISMAAVMLASKDSPVRDLHAGFSTGTAAIGDVDGWGYLDRGGYVVRDVLILHME